MTKSVNLQHRHFVLIAETIANLSVPEEIFRHYVACKFADRLESTNPKFDRARFVACAMGTPCSGRAA